MIETVYLLCAFTSLLCAVMLLRGFLRTRARLLFWSCLCFCGLTLNNVLLVLDKLALKEVDLSLLRIGSALIALLPLLYGLIWDSD